MNKTNLALLMSFLIVMILQPTIILAADYELSNDNIFEKVYEGSYRETSFTITNLKKEPMTLTITRSLNLSLLVKLPEEEFVIPPESKYKYNYTIFGNLDIGEYDGFIGLKGGFEKHIPVRIQIVQKNELLVPSLLMEIKPLSKVVDIGSIMKYKVDLRNLLNSDKFNVTLTYFITKVNQDEAVFTIVEEHEISTSSSFFKQFKVPTGLSDGEYIIEVKANYLGKNSSYSTMFSVHRPLWQIRFFGLFPLWMLMLGIIFIVLMVVLYIWNQRRLEKKKKYKSLIDYSQIPKKGPRTICLGKIAETEKLAYYDLDQLMMHTLIAGSTGGGKTVSAEVMVEEALEQDVSIIVFDPTAQWSGFLRKCQNQKMINLYPKFGLKKTDTKAFNGNVFQITDARETVDIKKYIRKGEINVFTVNKLDPKEVDILISNTISQVFKANLPESSELKLIIIFDEVHRLLPKFGGSGEGFVQVERAVREFRKYGVGLILISQVLTDFIGQTKSNIANEVQMRTRDQGDLERIKMKYGGYMLQSLLKASSGTGMIENPAYNNGKPYFVSFRPLRHEHARLSDKELDEYNKYNVIIEDIEYQMEQLEGEGVDVFDLKLELKIALDKVKTGNFNMVNIYLDGLMPRIDANWEKIGKKPKKKTKEFISDEERMAEQKKAEESRTKSE